MMHVWSVLCYKGIVDRPTNNISLIEILEEIHITHRETNDVKKGIANITPMPMNWITLFARTDFNKPEKKQIKDTIIAPSGKIITEKEYEIDLMEHKRSRRIRAVLTPPSNELGVYLFQTRIKDDDKKPWKKVADIPLEVTSGEFVESKKQPNRK